MFPQTVLITDKVNSPIEFTVINYTILERDISSSSTDLGRLLLNSEVVMKIRIKYFSWMDRSTH